MRPQGLRVLVFLAALVGGLQLTSAQDTGIKVKKPVLAGACKVCPWGAVAEIVKDAMKPYGYDVLICYNCARSEGPRIVAGAKVPPPLVDVPDIPRSQRPDPPHGPADFGATSVQNLWYAYQGSHAYASDGPRNNLRLFAVIQSPNYLMVAAKSELGITDLRQVKQKKWPVRILVGNEGQAVLDYYGLTKQAVESAGGHIGASSLAPEERKNFDLVVAGGTLANAPEFNVWYEVTQKFDLTFIQLPDELLDKLAKDFDMQRGYIPNGLLRGIDHAIPTVTRTGHAVFGRSDNPDDFAYTVAKALDEHQDLLQWSHLNFSYNPRTVWKAFGVPLHPGAARYYRERGYMK